MLSVQLVFESHSLPTFLLPCSSVHQPPGKAGMLGSSSGKVKHGNKFPERRKMVAVKWPSSVDYHTKNPIQFSSFHTASRTDTTGNLKKGVGEII